MITPKLEENETKTLMLKDFILKLIPSSSFSAIRIYQRFLGIFGDSCEFTRENIGKLYKEEFSSNVLRTLLGLTDNCIDVASEIYEEVKCKRCSKDFIEELYITEDIIFGFLGFSPADKNVDLNHSKYKSKLLDLLFLAFDVALEIPEENFEENLDE